MPGARQSLAAIVEPRYRELFELVHGELRRGGFVNDRGEVALPAGVVLTGGSSKMEGATDLAEELFHTPVRLGSPQHVAGLADVVRNPIHATGVGLLIYGARQGGARNAPPDGAGFASLLQRIRDWFREEL